MFHTTFYYYYYLHLHLHWGGTDLSFVAICKSSLNKYVYNNIVLMLYKCFVLAELCPWKYDTINDFQSISQ